MENPSIHQPAKRFPPPVAPPLSSANLQDWFEELRAVDTEVTQYAVGIVQEHFARAGVEVRPELAGVRDWRGFGLYLALALMPIMDQEGDVESIRALLADLVDFSLFNPYDGAPDGRLAALLAQFIQWEPSYVRRGRVTALLPAKANAALKRSGEEAARTTSLTDYDSLVAGANSIFESLRSARLASEEDVASAIFTAATDGTNQLRYVATQDIAPLVNARRETSEQHYMEFMRANFMPK